MPAAAAPPTIRTQPHHGMVSPESSSPVVEVGATTTALAAVCPPWVTVWVVVTVLGGVVTVLGGVVVVLGGVVTVLGGVVTVLGGVVTVAAVVWAAVAVAAVVAWSGAVVAAVFVPPVAFPV